MMKVDRVQKKIYFPPEDWERLCAFAERAERTSTQVIVMATRLFLASGDAVAEARFLSGVWNLSAKDEGEFVKALEDALGERGLHKVTKAVVKAKRAARKPARPRRSAGSGNND